MTVSRRKDTGQWVTDFYHNGERIRKTLKFVRTKKEAEAAEAVIMNQVFQQVYGFDGKPDRRFDDFVVDTFLPYSEANKKSFRCDVLICRVLVKAFKNKTLRQITPPLIETFKQDFLNTPTRHGKKRSAATVNYHLRVLSKILSMAVDAEILESNPSRRVRTLKLDNQRTRVLSDEEERRLLEALSDNEPVQQIVTLALHTGLRRGEIFNLAWTDIDFGRRTLIVQQSKSGKKRVVPMNTTVTEMLKNTVRRGDLVFPSPRTGGKLIEIKRSFNRALSEAKIENLRFHDLRHTAATRMADAGADAFTLMKILGHSDIRMTSRYTHATDSALRKAVENLDARVHFGHEVVTEQKGRLGKIAETPVNTGAGDRT
ncbi:MAG: tyrosine-type recombinase/integrase [Pyrinomonadaceae bacterium]